MSEWKECKLGDVAKLINGFAFKGSDFLNSGVPVIKIKNVKPGKILLDNLSYVSVLIASEKEKYLINSSDILITMSGNRSDGSPDSWVGKVSLFKVKGQYLLNQRVGILRPIINPISIEYLAFLLSSMEYQQHFINLANSSGGQANISPETILNTKIELPSLAEQRAIAGVLSSLDDKINLLHRQNKTLEGMAEALWRKMFVEDAKNLKIVNLGEIIEIHDSKRIPLSSMQREKMKDGVLYPYYGAATVMDYINRFIFEGEYLLLGEDGTVETDDGFPVLQLATGKFWVNNHTHVLRAKKPFSNFLLYIILRNTNITHIVTGAVQPKINQENLKSLEISSARDITVNELSVVADNFWQKIQANNFHIRTLSHLRDTLLPKLMSGEVRVKL